MVFFLAEPEFKTIAQSIFNLTIITESKSWLQLVRRLAISFVLSLLNIKRPKFITLKNNAFGNADLTSAMIAFG